MVGMRQPRGWDAELGKGGACLLGLGYRMGCTWGFGTVLPFPFLELLPSRSSVVASPWEQKGNEGFVILGWQEVENPVSDPNDLQGRVI